MTRVLLIGRTGQLARALCETAPADIKLAAVGRPRVDLARPGSARAEVLRQRPDIVINAAAFTDVDGAERTPARANAINAEAVAELARATRDTGAALLHVSTDHVFAGTSDRPYVETAAALPCNIYGATKLCGERLALTENPRTAILRTSWLHAPWGRNFVQAIVAAAERSTALRVVADQRGTPTSAIDLAVCCHAIMPSLIGARAGADVFGITHATNRGSCTWAAFAGEILSSSGGNQPKITRISSAEWSSVAARPAYSVLDTTRLFKVFGVRLPEWRDGVARSVAGLRLPENA